MLFKPALLAWHTQRVAGTARPPAPKAARGCQHCRCEEHTVFTPPCISSLKAQNFMGFFPFQAPVENVCARKDHFLLSDTNSQEITTPESKCFAFPMGYGSWQLSPSIKAVFPVSLLTALRLICPAQSRLPSHNCFLRQQETTQPRQAGRGKSPGAFPVEKYRGGFFKEKVHT